MPIDAKLLSDERDKLKVALRELETEQRKLEAELKVFRQKEIQIKREIEALSVLLDIADAKSDDSPDG